MARRNAGQNFYDPYILNQGSVGKTPDNNMFFTMNNSSSKKFNNFFFNFDQKALNTSGKSAFNVPKSINDGGKKDS